MLSDEPNSIKIGDIIVLPHQPAQRRYSLVRVTGPYEYGPPRGGASIGTSFQSNSSRARQASK